MGTSLVDSTRPTSDVVDKRSLSHLRRLFSLGWGPVLPATDALHGRPTDRFRRRGTELLSSIMQANDLREFLSLTPTLLNAKD